MTVTLQDKSQAFQQLKDIISELGEELHWPASRVLKLTPNASLEKDLGLDSLSRVELASRLERKFGVILGEKIFLSVDTLADLVAVITAAPTYDGSIAGEEGIFGFGLDLSQDVKVPLQARTLVDAVEAHNRQTPDRVHIVFMNSEMEAVRMTYGELYLNASKVASSLVGFGVKKGDSVAIMLPTCLEYFYCFIGTMLCGGVPIAIYPPSRPSQLIDHVQRHVHILKNANAKLLVTDTSSLGRVGKLLQVGFDELKILDAKTDLLTGSGATCSVDVFDHDRAFIQYTSGSTGSPKGVILTHGNILANIRAMGEVLNASPQDVFVSWLPLYHDMGLIGAWLGSLYYGCALVVMSPFSFLSRPRLWLEMLDKFHGTLTAAPNFAFELCVKHIAESDAQRLDLSSVRVMCNGAEPVNSLTVSRFLSRFKASKLDQHAMMPVYGLAESTVGLAFPNLGADVCVDIISRATLERDSVAVPCDPGSTDTIEIVGCGYPLPGHEIRVVSGAGHELSERNEGRIQFRGPSSTSGYLNQELETKRLFRNGWLDTGDLGYVANGQLFVTGRIKDLIKHAGRNVHPEDIEMAIGDLSDVRKGCVAVFGSRDADRGTERLVVVAETRIVSPEGLERITHSINATIANLLGFPPDEVRLVSPHTLLKTSSGKLRRSACKSLYENGELEKSGRHVKIRLLSFVVSSYAAKLKRLISADMELLRSVYIWTSAVVLVVFVWPFAAFLPKIDYRWSSARVGARVLLWFAGVKLIKSGKQLDGPGIYVSNHASYSDVICLLAALPRPVSFVAKAELKRWLPVKFTLDRLGVIYVERHELASSLRDAQYVTQVAKKGGSLLSFPEGTFTRKSGVLPFHMGPFLTAVESELPIVPIMIRGTRSVLHPDSWVIRRGSVQVDILEPIFSDKRTMEHKASTWNTALDLRTKARAVILGRCGEPDLAMT